ncbi:MAG: hypothetical protein IJ828_00030 [Treponema sp.]|nr:hypothetical protein [Treponema sp.]
MKEAFILEVKARLTATVTPNQRQTIENVLREELEGCVPFRKRDGRLYRTNRKQHEKKKRFRLENGLFPYLHQKI